jgi:hypothetical protein
MAVRNVGISALDREGGFDLMDEVERCKIGGSFDYCAIIP